MATVRISTKNFENDLKQLQRGMRGQVLSDAVWLGGELIKADAKRRAPFDTGNLRSSITNERTVTRPTRAEVAIGPSKQAPYGIHVEFGTRFMAAQPFLRPAMDKNRKRVGVVIGEFLERRMRQLVG